MWMVDNNEHGKESKMSIDDPMFDRKLRPLMPRPFPTTSTPPRFYTQNPNCILPLWNHPIGGVSDYGVKREKIHAVPLVSTRWNPTSEQLQALEEMYRRGTRTPTAEQIQQIAARLRRFGKIEGKNVFYWFQNHKARERQKKRRQLDLISGNKVHHHHQVESTLETKQTGLSRKYIEIENHKKLPTPTNCSTPSEDSVSMHGSVIAERKKLDVWTELHQKELQRGAKNDITSWKLDLLSSCNNTNDHDNIINECVIEENRTTLQLFPINVNREDEIRDVSRVYVGNESRPNEFIEFLPTKK